MLPSGRIRNRGQLIWRYWMFIGTIGILALLLPQPSLSVKDIGVPSKTSKWCSEAMTGVNDVPKAVKPLMIFLCTLHAGGVKTFEDVGFCMDTVKLLCLHECESSPDDYDYRACVFDADVVAAYQISEQRFLECMGAEQQCIRLQKDWKAGDGCWQQCYKKNSVQCMEGCKPVTDGSPEATKYLRCAMKMNPAHETFRNCILQRIPVIPNAPPTHTRYRKNTNEVNALMIPGFLGQWESVEWLYVLGGFQTVYRDLHVVCRHGRSVPEKPQPCYKK